MSTQNQRLSKVAQVLQRGFSMLRAHKTQLFACLTAAIILTQCCGLVAGIGVQKAFAEAAPETYTMTNVIYINRTGLNRAGAYVDCITISETAKPIIDLPIKDGTHHKDLFAPNISIDVDKMQSLYDRQDTAGQDVMTFAGYSINITNAKYVMASQMANGEILPVNTSDFFGCGFEKAAISFPVIEKAVLFDSPAYYAQQYCAQNGYALRGIINSTYTKEYNMDTLNTFYSQLVKDDTIITYNQSMPVLYAGAAKYGVGLNPKIVPIAVYYLIVAIGILLTMIAIPVITTWIDNEAALDGLKETNKANLEALADGLNATKQLADHMLTDKNAQRQLVMNFYANGTISWEQMQYLLKNIDGSYNPLINNCTTNIAAMVAGYFNASLQLYGEFAEGVFNATSWTDWILDLIYLIAAFIVAYIIYVIISKFKGASSGTQSVSVFYPPAKQ